MTSKIRSAFSTFRSTEKRGFPLTSRRSYDRRSDVLSPAYAKSCDVAYRTLCPTFSDELQATLNASERGLFLAISWNNSLIGSISIPVHPIFSRCHVCEAMEVGSLAPTSTKKPFSACWKYCRTSSFSRISTCWIFLENMPSPCRGLVIPGGIESRGPCGLFVFAHAHWQVGRKNDEKKQGEVPHEIGVAEHEQQV